MIIKYSKTEVKSIIKSEMKKEKSQIKEIRVDTTMAFKEKVGERGSNRNKNEEEDII